MFKYLVVSLALLTAASSQVVCDNSTAVKCKPCPECVDTPLIHDMSAGVIDIGNTTPGVGDASGTFTIKTVHECGKERWDVKTLQDGFKLPITIQSVTVADLRKLPKPETLPSTRLPQETKLVAVRVWLHGFKIEDDKDLHIVLSGTSSRVNTIIGEIPAPNCADDSLRQVLIEARSSLIAITRHKLPKSVGQMYWLPKPIEVLVEGMVFFDKIHGQTGVAPNGVEIHPIIKISSLFDITTPNFTVVPVNK